ncbi:GntR family transcriptional regulator [Pararhodobacter aggregans]|nr:GntR family transcriptional regulator [Pararhodobacter aggregans]PTX03261.1 DNA-binding GntR family transcriptional regulator [Pararhodobacter aggregans]
MMNSIQRVADLRQQVYETLKARITEGGFDPDTKFQEINLAQELGVSRTPVREALAMLVRDGLLVQATRGFRFPNFTPEEISEVIEIRLLLEPHAVAKLVRETDAGRLFALAGRIHQTLDETGESDAYVEAHRKIRDDIYSHVSNRQLVAAIARYEDFIHFIRINTLRRPDMRRVSVNGMAKLAQAIGTGNEDEARAVMTMLLTQAGEAFKTWAAENAEPRQG